MAVAGEETVGLSAAGEVLEELLGDALVGSLGILPFELITVLPLTALSSSSDEISTTIRVDIISCRLLARLVRLSSSI